MLLKQDKEKINKLKQDKQKLELEAIEKIHKVDKDIVRIQQSTRTSIPIFIPLHAVLRMKWRWYYLWHLNQFADTLHYVVLVFCIVFSGLYVSMNLTEKPKMVFAADTVDYTWDGGGDGSTWTDANNWDKNSGYPHNPEDKAIFSSGSTSVSIPSGLSIAKLEMTSGYSGTLSLAGTLTLSDFTGGSESTPTNAGDLTINGGTLSTSSNSIYMTGNLTLGSGGTFTKGGGTLTFNGTRATTFSDGHSTPHDMGIVVISKNNGTASNNKLTLNSSMTVDTMTISSSNTLDASSYTLKLANAGSSATVFTINGTFTKGSSTINYAATNSGGNVNITTTVYNNLTLSGSENYDMQANLTSSNALSGDLTISTGATMNAYVGSTSYNLTCVNVSITGTLFMGTNSSTGTGTFTASGNWTHNNGTFTYGKSTVILSGTGSLNASDSKRFYNLQMGYAAKTTTLANSVKVQNVLTTQSGNIDSSCGWTATVAINATGSSYVTDATTPATWGSSTTVEFYPYGNITLPKAQFNKLILHGNSPTSNSTSLDGNLTVANDLQISGYAAKNMTLDTNGKIVSVGQDLLIGTSGTTNAYGKLNLNGTSMTITRNVVIYTSDASGDNEISNSGSNPSLTVGGNWTNSDKFTSNSIGTVTFNGTANQTADATTFYNLTLNNTGGSGSDKLIPATGCIVGGSLTMTDGTLDLSVNNANFSVYGNTTIASISSVNKGTGTWTFAGTTAATYTDSTSAIQNLGIVVINKTDTSAPATNDKLTLASSITVDTINVDQTSGQEDRFDMANGGYVLKISVAGATATPFVLGSYFTAGNGKVECDATNSGGNITVPASITFYNLTFNPSSTEIYDLSGNLTGTYAIGGELNIGTNATLDIRPSSTDYSLKANSITFTGTLDATSASSSIEIVGNWTNTGTFNRGTSHVYLSGDGTISTVSSFYDLDCAYTGKTTLLATDITTWDRLTTQSGNINSSNTTERFIQTLSGVSNPYVTDSTTPATWGNYSKYYLYHSNISLGKAQFNKLTLYGNTNTVNTVTLTGNVTIASNLDFWGNASGKSTIIDTAGYNLSVTGITNIGKTGDTTKYAKLNVNGGTTTLTGNVTVYASDTSGNNEIALTSGTLKVGGNFTNNDIFSGTGAGIEFNGTTNQTLTTNAQAINNLTINNSGTSPNNKVTLNDSLDVNGNLTITSGNLDSNGKNITISGNFSNSATFTYSTSTVTIDGSGTSAISGVTTFYNFTCTTAGKTITFQHQTSSAPVFTFAGTFTLTGASGNNIVLQSDSTGTQWLPHFNNATTTVTYTSVKDSGGDTGSATVSNLATDTNLGNNNTSVWLFNQTPNSPTSLAQKKTDDSSIATGAWINVSSVKFTASASDPDSSDTLYLCIEKQPIGTSFTNTENGCGTGVSYSGSPVLIAYTISSLTDATQYHWQTRVKDTAGAYSSWVSYGGNAESASDFGIDTTAPTGGTVNDGVSAPDIDYNDGSLTSLSANWSGFDTSVSGLSGYEYEIMRQSDSYYWDSSKTEWVASEYWESNGTNTTVTISDLILQTGVQYIFKARATDNAGNVGSAVSSNGQQVLPTLSFSLDSNTVTFNNLNSANSWTDTKTNVLSTSTNASNGYSICAYLNQILTSTAYPTQTVANFTGTWTSPQTWNSGTYGFGYTSFDTLIQGSNRFVSGTKFAGFSTSSPGDIVADHTDVVDGTTGAVSDEQFTIQYKIAVSAIQAATTYSAYIYYIATANY